MEFSFSPSPALALLFVFAAAAISVFFYHITLPPVPRYRRISLAFLRTIVLALLATLLLEPVLQFINVTNQAPIIAVLADRSASMSIVDRIGSREETLRKVLEIVVPKAIPSGAEVANYSFGSSLRGPLRQPLDTLGDDITDIARALRGLLSERERLNICAVVLVSDGMYTTGENPVHDALAVGIPVFTVGVGDTAEQKDVLVSRISANDRVYAGTMAPVDVVVRSSGYGGERTELTLNDGVRTLDRALVTLPVGTAEVSAHLEYTPEGEGVRRYTIHISPLPGELTKANNQRVLTVRILRSTMRVLLFAAGPNSDLSIIRQTLREDANLSVKTRTQKSQVGFYEGPVRLSDLDSADCLITIGLPDAASASSTLDLIRNAIAEGHKPLFFFGGKNIDVDRLLLMVPSLPVTADFHSKGEQEVGFSIDPSRSTYPVLALGPNGESDAWSRLPPIFVTGITYRLREGAVLLGSPRMLNVILPQPLMALRNIAGTRSLAVMGYGVWRWRLMAQGNTETAPLFKSFLSAGIRWLTSRDEGKPVRVMPSKDQFSQGEQVKFTSQVYDVSSQPVDNAQVHVTIAGKQESVEIDLRPISNGRYEGSVEGLPQGEFTFRASATQRGIALGEDTGSFLVGGLNLEFLDTRMNIEVLRQLAYRTGGRFFDAADADRLRSAMDSLVSLTTRVEYKTESFNLQRWPYVLFLLILLFSVEWIMRKRFGML